MATWDDFIKSELALLAWREERSNQVNGMLGVCFIVRNRVKKGWFGSSWLGNINGHGQFSSMTILGDSQTIKYPVMNDPQFTQILQLVDEVYDQDNPRVDNLTNGSLYYADLNNPTFTKGGWFDREILQKSDIHSLAATIGTTSYFK